MALGLTMPILQFVGFQNSGKTTVMSKVIRYLSEQGLRVGTIKHHGHGGKPELPLTGKDSVRHFHAGAAVSAVEGDGLIQIHAKKSQWNLDEIVNMYKQFPLDVLLIEGYKKSSYPKVVFIRNREDIQLLKTILNVKIVISWCECTDMLYPVFSIDDDASFVLWIYQYIKNELEIE